jgi:hypothetical protein
VKRQNLIDGLLFVILLVIGSQVRVWLQDLPNFAPVAALALFAGYFFRSWLLALCLPLGVMLLSDVRIGGYDWRMMTLVYGMLAAPVGLGLLMRRYLHVQRQAFAPSALAFGGLMGCSLAGAVLFFLTTNFGSWLWFDMYERSLSGLVLCYTQAIPFFRYTLCGDLLFATVLFGGYALAVQCGFAARTKPALGTQ